MRQERGEAFDVVGQGMELARGQHGSSHCPQASMGGVERIQDTVEAVRLEKFSELYRLY